MLENPNWRTAVREGEMMRKFVMGVALCMAFGLPASAADSSGSKAAQLKHPGMRLACHWVATDRTLRPLGRTASAANGMSRTAAPADRKSIKAPAVKASPVVTRAEPVHVARQSSQRIALVVGVGF
jgi:hypothetical protein